MRNPDQPDSKKLNQTYDSLIVGAGFSGLSAAYNLVQKKRSCLIVEPQTSLGGLVASYDFGNFRIEKYYHHLLANDSEMVDLSRKLGIERDLHWLPASTGHLDEKKLHLLDTAIDILRFPLLSFFDKVKLAKLVKTIFRYKDLKYLDTIPVQDWIREKCGERVLENFFKPLIYSKFGSNIDNISAAWMVGRIQFRANRSAMGERLGYYSGGFQLVIDKFYEKIAGRCDILTEERVENISRQKEGFVVKTNKRTLKARTVISTVAPKVLSQIAPLSEAEFNRLAKLPFQHSLCCVVALKKKLTKTYWCNIVNRAISFALFIEHTNFFKDPHYPPSMLYLANYCQTEDDPLWQLSDREVRERHTLSLERFFGVDRNDILWWKTSRAKDSSLIYNRGVYTNLPPLTTSIEGLYNIGLMRSFPDRSTNDSVKQGREAAEATHQYLASSTPAK